MRTEQLHQFERADPALERNLRVFDGCRKLRAPFVAQLLFDQRDPLSSPGAGNLGLFERGDQAFAAMQYVVGHLTIPYDAINPAFGIASTGAKVQPSVRTDANIRDVQRLAFEKNLGRSLVRG